MKRLIKYLFGDVIKDLVQERIDEMICFEPELVQRYKLGEMKKGNKLTVWEVLQMGFTSGCVCVDYHDQYNLKDFTVYNFETLEELREIIVNFNPKHSNFSSVSIHLTPRESAGTIIENIFRSDNVYNTKEIQKVFEPIYQFFKKYPELCI